MESRTKVFVGLINGFDWRNSFRVTFGNEEPADIQIGTDVIKVRVFSKCQHDGFCGLIDTLSQKHFTEGSDFENFVCRIRLDSGSESRMASTKILKHLIQDALEVETFYDSRRCKALKINGSESAPSHQMRTPIGIVKFTFFPVLFIEPSMVRLAVPVFAASERRIREIKIRGSQRIRAINAAE